MASIEIFKNESFGEVRVAGTSEQPMFCLADICRILEIKNVSDCKSKLKQDGVVLTEGVSKTTNQYGVTTEQKVMLTFINEQNLYKVIMRSDKPQAEPFQDWVCGEVLPSIRKHGTYSVDGRHSDKIPLTPSTVCASLEWVKGVSEILNLNDSSKLALLGKVAQPLGLPTPDYTSSHGILKSATELLKENGVNISVQDFNRLLVEKGYLVTLTRKSTSGKEKQFKSITDKGLKYGENQVNPKNPKSTQPLWYENRFLNLLSTVGIN